MTDDLKVLKAELLAHTDAAVGTIQKLLDVRINYERQALEAAMKANDKVLAGMNEIRSILSDQQAKLITRAEVEQSFASLRLQMDSEFKPIVAQQAEMGKPNYALIVSLLSAAFALVTGGWLVIGLKIDVANTPLALALSTLITEEQQIGLRVRTVEQTIAEGRAARQLTEGVARAKVAELETQFKALSDTMNIEKDHIERWLAIYFEKLYPGEKFPPTRFRPNLYKQE